MYLGWFGVNAHCHYHAVWNYYKRVHFSICIHYYRASAFPRIAVKLWPPPHSGWSTQIYCRSTIKLYGVLCRPCVDSISLLRANSSFTDNITWKDGTTVIAGLAQYSFSVQNPTLWNPHCEILWVLQNTSCQRENILRCRGTVVANFLSLRSACE